MIHTTTHIRTLTGSMMKEVRYGTVMTRPVKRILGAVHAVSTFDGVDIHTRCTRSTCCVHGRVHAVSTFDGVDIHTRCTRSTCCVHGRVHAVSTFDGVDIHTPFNII